MKTKHENIAEYVLYLWQMEDVVRAFQTDEALLQNQFLTDLMAMMRAEGVMQSGHTQIAKVTVEEIEEMHQRLLDTDAGYRGAMLQLEPYLNILKSRSANPTQSDIDMMLVFLYQVMTLRLEKQEISEETLIIQQQVSRMLAYLSKTYKEADEDNQLED